MQNQIRESALKAQCPTTVECSSPRAPRAKLVTKPSADTPINALVSTTTTKRRCQDHQGLEMKDNRYQPTPWQSVHFFFGSSFNPPTKAHVGILKWLATLKVTTFQNENTNDETSTLPITVLAAPVYKHAFAATQRTKSNMPAFDDRKKMTEIALAQESDAYRTKIEVSNIEKIVANAPASKDAHKTVGTFDVIRHLQKTHENTLIIPVLGEDTFQDIKAGKWKNSKALLTSVPILVIGRSPDAASTCRIHYPEGWEDLFKIIWQAPPENYSGISSTGARSASSEEEMANFLPENSAQDMMLYMQQKHLYQWQKPPQKFP